MGHIAPLSTESQKFRVWTSLSKNIFYFVNLIQRKSHACTFNFYKLEMCSLQDALWLIILLISSLYRSCFRAVLYGMFCEYYWRTKSKHRHVFLTSNCTDLYYGVFHLKNAIVAIVVDVKHKRKDVCILVSHLPRHSGGDYM